MTKYKLHQKELAAEHGKDKQLCVQIAKLVLSGELSSSKVCNIATWSI